MKCEHCEMSFDSERQLSRHQRACVAKDQKDAKEEAQKIRYGNNIRIKKRETLKIAGLRRSAPVRAGLRRSAPVCAGLRRSKKIFFR